MRSPYSYQGNNTWPDAVSSRTRGLTRSGVLSSSPERRRNPTSLTETLLLPLLTSNTKNAVPLPVSRWNSTSKCRWPRSRKYATQETRPATSEETTCSRLMPSSGCVSCSPHRRGIAASAPGRRLAQGRDWHFRQSGLDPPCLVVQRLAGRAHEVVITVSNPHGRDPLPPVFLQFQLQPLGKIWFRVFAFPGRESRHLQVNGAKRSGIAGSAYQDIKHSPHGVVDAGTRPKLLAQLLAVPIEVPSADPEVGNTAEPVRYGGFVLGHESPSAHNNVPAAMGTPLLSRRCGV
jgi:hypothetical protein